MRSFGRIIELYFVCAALVAPMALCDAAVVLDAPGHATLEGVAVTARGGEPGAQWRLVDWRDREVENGAGIFDEHGETTLPPLPAGYYRMIGVAASSRADDGARPEAAPPKNLATLAVVSPLVTRHSSLVTVAKRRGRRCGFHRA